MTLKTFLMTALLSFISLSIKADEGDSVWRGSYSGTNSKKAEITVRIVGRTVLQDLRFTNCDPASLYFWQSCRNQYSAFGEAYFAKEIQPPEKLISQFNLHGDFKVLELKNAGLIGPKVILILRCVSDESKGAIIIIPNPFNTAEKLAIELSRL